MAERYVVTHDPCRKDGGDLSKQTLGDLFKNHFARFFQFNEEDFLQFVESVIVNHLKSHQQKSIYDGTQAIEVSLTGMCFQPKTDADVQTLRGWINTIEKTQGIKLQLVATGYIVTHYYLLIQIPNLLNPKETS